MKPGIERHPAYLFGRWIREQRLARHIGMRDMAVLLDIDLCRYSEIEHGIIRWLNDNTATKLMHQLFDHPQDKGEFLDKWQDARMAEPKLTCLGDVLELVEVLPPRPIKKKNGERMTAEEMIELGKFVLAPLDERTEEFSSQHPIRAGG